MARVMAVVFERYGQLHYLDPLDGEYAVGDWVLYPTPEGLEIAQCVWAPEESTVAGSALPACGGRATKTDLARDAVNRDIRANALRYARELVARDALPMKVVAADYIDRSDEFGRLTAIYFTAPHRVDFRQLLRDLARGLSSRIDLRQVGERDAARLLGGIGACGRDLCCSTFLVDLEPVSLRLAKVQGLSPNPMQIEGACGRLLCCLKFENDSYVEFMRRAPAVGEWVEVSGRSGVVTGHNVPSDCVDVRVGRNEVLRCPRESVCSKRGARSELPPITPGEGPNE